MWSYVCVNPSRVTDFDTPCVLPIRILDLKSLGRSAMGLLRDCITNAAPKLLVTLLPYCFRKADGSGFTTRTIPQNIDFIEKSGEPCRIRTCDPLIKSQLLYQLS